MHTKTAKSHSSASTVITRTLTPGMLININRHIPMRNHTSVNFVAKPFGFGYRKRDTWMQVVSTTLR